MSISPSLVLKPSENGEFSDWSGSFKTVKNSTCIAPANEKELVELVRSKNKVVQDTNEFLRPCGRIISPNGLALQKRSADTRESQKKGVMVSLEHFDHLELLEKEGKFYLKAGAGATVQKILDFLAEHGKTLPNFSSVTWMSLGGWMQVGAHGSGIEYSTVENDIVELKVCAPGINNCEITTLCRVKDEEKFLWVASGIGLFGFVTEMTLPVVDQFQIHERYFILDHEEIKAGHEDRLKKHTFVNYHWFPFTKSVLVIARDIVDAEREGKKEVFGEDLFFARKREELLRENPIDFEVAKKVSRAEVKFWTDFRGKYSDPEVVYERLDDSTKILGFECGKGQRTIENCFPISGIDGSDLDYAFELLEEIEKRKIPIHSFFEQRWNKASSSKLSLSYSEDPTKMFSWCGTMMYRISFDEGENKEINKIFNEKVEILQAELGKKYGGICHWSKQPLYGESNFGIFAELVENYFDLEKVKAARDIFDEKRVFGKAPWEV